MASIRGETRSRHEPSSGPAHGIGFHAGTRRGAQARAGCCPSARTDEIRPSTCARRTLPRAPQAAPTKTGWYTLYSFSPCPRKWRNWQTRKPQELVGLRPVGVQVPPSAPLTPSATPDSPSHSGIAVSGVSRASGGYGASAPGHVNETRARPAARATSALPGRAARRSRQTDRRGVEATGIPAPPRARRHAPPTECPPASSSPRGRRTRTAAARSAASAPAPSTARSRSPDR